MSWLKRLIFDIDKDYAVCGKRKSLTITEATHIHWEDSSVTYPQKNYLCSACKEIYSAGNLDSFNDFQVHYANARALSNLYNRVKVLEELISIKEKVN